MTVLRVTFLAKDRHTSLEKAISRRSMRLMANRAVFRHWFMVMHERTALFHVASEASLVGTGFDQLFRIVSMHVVTGRTRHLSLDDRVMRRFVDLGALFFVAGETDLGFGYLFTHLVVLRMNLMAGCAGNILVAVSTHLPANAVTALVTGQAGAIAIFCRRFGAFAEIPIGQWLIATSPERPMFLTLAMAIGTSWRAAIGLRSMTRLADSQYRRMQLEHGRLGFIGLVMAACAFGIALEHQVLGGLRGFGRLGGEGQAGARTPQAKQNRPYEQMS